MGVLRGYDWPGNVRQLGNAIEQATVLCSSEVIDVRDLPQHLKIHREAFPKRRTSPSEPVGHHVADWTVVFTPSARKELEQLPEPPRDRILTKIEKLAKNPHPRGVRKLKGRNGSVTDTLW